jgi:actin-related protein
MASFGGRGGHREHPDFIANLAALRLQDGDNVDREHFVRAFVERMSRMSRGEPVEQPAEEEARQPTERSVEDPRDQEAEERAQQEKQDNSDQQDPLEFLDESQPEFAPPEVVLDPEQVMS